MNEIKIIDIIDHKNQCSTQRFLVVSRKPKFTYERRGDFLIGEDSGFFNFYAYDSPSLGIRAFAGSKFDIPMKDGSTIKANGQWWNAMPEDYYGLLNSSGVSTIAELSKCHVFCSGNIDPQLIEDWLKGNEPGNNYHKYDERHPDFGKNTIESKFK